MLKLTMTDRITIDEFAKIEIRVGLVVKAEEVTKSRKLIRLTVDFKDFTRTIFTGVRGYGYSAADFTDKQFLFVVNVEPKKIMDEESQGMILAVGEEKPIFICADNLPLGTKVR